MAVKFSQECTDEILILADLLDVNRSKGMNHFFQIGRGFKSGFSESIFVLLGALQHHLAQKFLFVLEMTEQRHFIDLGCAGNFPGGCAGNAVPGKNTCGSLEDPLVGVFHASTYLHRFDWFASQRAILRCHERRLVCHIDLSQTSLSHQFSSPMTYLEALSFLGQTRFFGMKLGLDRMRRIAGALGDPQKNLRFVHLAGTNGKGSTAAFCESCLRTSGYRVGLYTSPHLVSIRERIQIDRVPIGEGNFAQGIKAVRHAMGQGEDSEVTFFEIMTALALWYFAREKVDWVIWETGLGGRLDATNIVDSELCIITNIGLDHQQYLGQSLREIAEEKAGIIKPGVPSVITAVKPGEAGDVILHHSDQAGSKMHNVDDNDVKDMGFRNGKQWAQIFDQEFELGLIGAHQAYNAACAILAMQDICSMGNEGEMHERMAKLTDDNVALGLKNTVWPGRFEILSEKPLVVLDGAHNPAAMKSLVETWRNFLGSRFGWSREETDARTHLVFASVADKDITEMAQLLRPLVQHVSLVRLANERGAEPEMLAKSFSSLPTTCYDSVAAAWQDIVTVHSERVTLITGSLFLVGEILARRQGNAEEYRLNERLEKLTVTR